VISQDESIFAINGKMDTIFDEINGKLVNAIASTGGTHREDFMDTHFMYDLSAKKALFDLNLWIKRHQDRVKLPLFPDPLLSGAGNPKVCVSIATKRREQSPISYLVQGVSSLLNRMSTLQRRDSVYLHVFNVDNEPEKHTDVHLIRHLVPVSNVKVPIQPNGDFPIQSHYHENLDYADIMRHLYRIGCEYPIMIEDDALATEKWDDLVFLAIEELEARGNRQDWFVVKLFVARTHYPPLSRKGINSYDPRFNNVAFMMNRNRILQFADELEDMVRETVAKKDHNLNSPKDLFMDSFSRKYSLPIEAFEPVAFQHTGAYSSLQLRDMTRERVTSWIMFSKYFESEGKPVIFDPLRWEVLISTVSV
jgi:hypothetical protein